eukprot:Rmarinus@m.1922
MEKATIYSLTPLEVPYLSSLGKSEIGQFQTRRREYLRLVAERSDVDKSISARSLKSMIKLELLEFIADYELEGSPIEVEQVDDKLLEQYLEKRVTPSQFEVINLEDTFRDALKLDNSNPDPTQWVAQLWTDWKRLSKERLGNRKVEEKVQCKLILSALRPNALCKYIQDAIVQFDCEAKASVRKLFLFLNVWIPRWHSIQVEAAKYPDPKLLSSHSNCSAYSNKKLNKDKENKSGKPVKTSMVQVTSGKKQAQISPELIAKYSDFPFPPGQCWYCSSKEHRSLNECPTVSAEEKAAIWHVFSRNGVATRSARNKAKKSQNLKENSDSQAPDKATVRRVEVDHSPHSNVFSGCVLADAVQVDFHLDSGASISTISEEVFGKVSSAPGAIVGCTPTTVVWILEDSQVERTLAEWVQVSVSLPTRSGRVRVDGVRLFKFPGHPDYALLGSPVLSELGIDPHEALKELLTPLGEGVEGSGSSTQADQPGEMPLDIELPGADDPGETRSALYDMLRRAEQKCSRRTLRKLQRLLARHADMWRTRLGADPPARVPPLRVRLAESGRRSSLLKAKARRCSKTQRSFLRAATEEQCKLGLAFRNHESVYASPVVLVRKPDSSLRLCVDLSVVNQLIESSPYPLPRLQQLFLYLNGKRFYAVLDLFKGFWQFPIDESCQEFFSFVTPDGIYTPTRVPMGGRTSAEHFQACMDHVLGDLILAVCLVYLDDILVFAESEDELVQNLAKVLAALGSAGIKLSPRKCTLFETSVKWCGVVVHDGRVAMCPERIEALSGMGRPVNAAELQQFICAANWMRSYIPDFARLFAPLQDLLASLSAGERRKKRLVAKQLGDAWNGDAEEAFRAAKRAIAGAVPLTLPNEDDPICLHTDASAEGWSAVLTQCNAAGQHLPLAFLSGRFSGAQANWATVDKEAFAIKEACIRLDYLVYSRAPFFIYTDHANLRYIFSAGGGAEHCKSRTVLDRLGRWAMQLQAFNYTVQHIPGAENHWADLLSRWGWPAKAVARRIVARGEGAGGPSEVVTADWPGGEFFQKAQSEAGPPPAGAILGADGLLRVDGALWVPATSRELKVKLLVTAHAGVAGHCGMERTQDRLEKMCLWEGLAGDVRAFVSSCLLCVATRPGQKVPRPLGHQLRGTMRNEVVHMDFLTMPRSHDGELRYVLVLKDDLTSFVRFVPSSAATAAVCVDALSFWIADFGIPKFIVSDQGSHFKNELVRSMCEKLDVHHHLVVAYSPWANGTVERVNIERSLDCVGSFWRRMLCLFPFGLLSSLWCSMR